MKRPEKIYDLFEHTADIGIQVYGRTLSQLFSHGGTALFDFMADLSSVDEEYTKELSLECFDREELFVRWLSELLYLHETEGLLLKRFDVLFIRGGRLRAKVYGGAFTPEHHRIFYQVKAVTYHQVKIWHENGIWMARVILDL
jgi:SHS2 domain-containing protein